MGNIQENGDFGLPLRPPACLAMLDTVEDGEGRESLLQDLRVEAREVQSRLKEQLLQFRTEVDIFLRLMYKNKNQHRHGLYYRRMLQVRRDLRLFDYSALKKTVEGFTRWTFPCKQSRVNVDQMNQDKDQVSSALCLLLSAARILNQIDKPILAASTQILALLSQSFFMSLGLTVFSSLARLRVLSQQLLFEFATVYNLLSLFSKEKPELPNLKAQLRDVLVEARSPALPLHLECHWDGGKLRVSEIEAPLETLENRVEVTEAIPLATPLSSGLWFVDDRKSLGASNNIVTGLPIGGTKVSRAGDLWFVDDRSRVNYDVCVSAITAREEHPNVDETTQNQSSLLLNESRGAASVSQSLKGEPTVKVSVTAELADGKGDVSIQTKGEQRDIDKLDVASFVTNLDESNSTLTRANKDISPEQVADLCAETKILSTEDQLRPVPITGATALDVCISAEPSFVAGANVDDGFTSVGRRPYGGSSSVSTGFPMKPVAGISEHMGLDLVSTRQEDEPQTGGIFKDDVSTVKQFAHDAENPKLEFNLDPSAVARKEDRKAIPGLILGTKRFAGEISKCESPDSEELMAKRRRKKRSKGSDRKTRQGKQESSTARQLVSKQESPKREDEVNEEMLKKEGVNDLFNMLLGVL